MRGGSGEREDVKANVNDGPRRSPTERQSGPWKQKEGKKRKSWTGVKSGDSC